MCNARGMGVVKEHRYSSWTDSALLFVLLICVCVCVFVLLNGGWVNGWLFVFTLVREYVGCLCLLHLNVPIWGNKNLCVCTGWVVRCGSAACVRTVLCIRELSNDDKVQNTTALDKTWEHKTHRRFRQHEILENTGFWEMQRGFMKWKWNGTKTQDLRKHKTEKHDRSQEYKISDDRLSVRRHSKILENKTLRQGFGKHSRIKENIAF